MAKNSDVQFILINLVNKVINITKSLGKQIIGLTFSDIGTIIILSKI